MTTRRAPHRAPPGAIRIIGGAFRGRRLPLPPNPALRPTPNRLRETLFNWLQPVVAGARVLDLYAGSGALGIEALSRGAAAATFVEQDAASARAIDAALAALGTRGTVVRADVTRFLAGPPPAPGEAFDLVFADPPFATGVPAGLCTLLAAGWLAPAAWIYLELPRAAAVPALPAGIRPHREATAGDVRGVLVHRPAGAG
jgi:16S rRNA (guanine966-N2)-methyltransferase